MPPGSTPFAAASGLLADRRLTGPGTTAPYPRRLGYGAVR